MIHTLSELCDATPGELEEATKIFANIKKEHNRLSQLGIGSQYEVETKDFYSLYLKAKRFPSIVKAVYSFDNNNQSKIKLFGSTEYEEFLTNEYVWCYTYRGKLYQVDNAINIDTIFEMLKYDYLYKALSTFHPSYHSINPKRYGDMPVYFASFVKRTEKKYHGG